MDDDETKPFLEDIKTSATDSFEVTVAPRLPPGKLFHIFFSYAEDDRRFASNVIEKLENELGYKCCDHLRDFVPGWKITDNIKHCVMSSLKTVVIISKQSIKSAWCSYETELTFHMSMEMRKKIIIPVLIDDCTVPDHLKPLTYIDARGHSNNWWEKLLYAANASDETPSFESGLPTLSTQPYTFNPNFSNLDNLVTLESRSRHCMSEEIGTKNVPNQLCSRGIQVPYSVFKENMSDLNKKILFHYHCCCYCRLCWIPWLVVISVVCIGGLIGCYLGVLICCGIQGDIFDRYTCDTLLPLAVDTTFIPPVLVITFVVLFILRKKKEGDLFISISDINKRLLSYQVMLTYKSHTFRRGFVISLVYYNYQPCLDYISTQLTNSSRLSLAENESEDISINIEDTAKDVLVKYSAIYLRQYFDGKLPNPSEQRHTRQALCLCQYVENIERLNQLIE